jgi:hypothetical protein
VGQHVQANIVSIDQYAKAATGNREFFLIQPAQFWWKTPSPDALKSLGARVISEG